jgi:hypothetical protein
MVLASHIHTQEVLNLRQHQYECHKSHILVTVGPKLKLILGRVSGTYEGVQSPAFSCLFIHSVLSSAYSSAYTILNLIF